MYLLSENSNVIYVYPGPSSIFYQIKGAFQTISNIVPQIVKNQTKRLYFFFLLLYFLIDKHLYLCFLFLFVLVHRWYATIN